MKRKTIRNRKHFIFKSTIAILNNNLDVLNDSRTKLVTRLKNKNKELNNINHKTRYIKRYGELNRFDFYDIPEDNDVEPDLNKFLDSDDNNKQYGPI